MKIYLLPALMLLMSAYLYAQRGDDFKKNFFSNIVSSYSKAELFDDISFGSFDLLSANLKYSKENNLQKIAFVPFKLLNKSSVFNDSRLNFTQKDGISTLGYALGYDNTNPYNKSKKVRRAFLATPPLPSRRRQQENETKEDYEKYLEGYNSALDAVRTDFMQRLAKNSFSFNVGYNISLFEIIGGDKVLNADSLIANQYVVKAHSFSTDFNYGINEDWGFNGGFSYIRKRQSAVEKQKMISYYGINFTVAWRAIRLQKEEQLKKDKDYLKSLFIPSIIVGCSFEYLKADGDSAYYEKGIKHQSILTPFLDFKISPKSQFRLGVPIRKFESVNKNQGWSRTVCSIFTCDCQYIVMFSSNRLTDVRAGNRYTA